MIESFSRPQRLPLATTAFSATFHFDVRPYLTNNFWRLGYQATNIVFIYLPVIYLLAAWKHATP